jgi:uncharacterized repeat protein (TIGR02543 family)
MQDHILHKLLAFALSVAIVTSGIGVDARAETTSSSLAAASSSATIPSPTISPTAIAATGDLSAIEDLTTEPSRDASYNGYIVTLKDAAAVDEEAQAEEASSTSASGDFVAVETPEDVLAFTNPDNIIAIEPNYVISALTPPNDTYYASNQWNLQSDNGIGLGVEAAWDENLDGTGINLAIFDTGFNYSIDDFNTSNVVETKDFTDLAVDGYKNPNPTISDNVNDAHGHGTMVSSFIGAIKNNNLQIAGIAPNSNFYLYKVLEDDGYGESEDVIFGLDYLYEQGKNFDVINFSLGQTEGPITAEETVIQKWLDKGTIVTAAASNNGPYGSADGTVDPISYPAGYPGVISVAATDNQGKHAYFSNENEDVDIAAPGQGVVSLMKTGGSGAGNGTSFASPEVAGVAALVKQYYKNQNKTLDAGVFLDLLKKTATQNGQKPATPTHNITYGWGLVNVPNIITKLNQEVQIPQLYTVTFHANGGSVTEPQRLVEKDVSIATLPTPTLEKHFFDGWYTQPAGGTLITPSTKITGSVTFYAHWTTDFGSADRLTANVTNTRTIDEAWTLYNNSIQTYNKTGLFATKPVLEKSPNFNQGVLSADAATKTIQQINYFRELAGMNSNITAYDAKMDYGQYGSTGMEIANTLTHEFTSDNLTKLSGYMSTAQLNKAKDGITAGNTDSIYTFWNGNVSSTNNIVESIQDYIDDTNNVVPGVGHRLNVLSPMGKAAVFGAGATKYSSLSIYGADLTQNTQAYYPWPSEGYFPKQSLADQAQWSVILNDTYDYIYNWQTGDITAPNVTPNITLSYNGTVYQATLIDADLIDNVSHLALTFELPSELRSKIASDSSAYQYAGEADVTVEITQLTNNNLPYYLKYTTKLFKQVPKPIASISLADANNAQSSTIAVGDSKLLTATFAPNDTTDQKIVTYTSSNASVATVDANGKITGVALGTATITATNAARGKTATYAVTVKKPVSNLMSDALTVTYTGNALNPALTIRDGSKVLTLGTDYTVSQYTNNINAGSATATITGSGDYLGSKTFSFTISPKSISTFSTANVTASALTYTGTAQTATFIVSDGAKTLVKDTDYTITGATQTNAGDYTAVITGKGNYSGTVNAAYTKYFIAKAVQNAPANVTGSATNNGNKYTYTLAQIAGAEYKMDTGAWQSSNVFTGITPGALASHTFAARLKETSNLLASPEKSSGAIGFPKLENLAIPTLDYAFLGDFPKQVAITTIPDAEYSFNGGVSYASSVDSNLYISAAPEDITLAIRFKATDTHNESTAITLSINTKNKEQDAPQKPVLTYKLNADAVTYTVTIPTLTGAEYSFDGIHFSTNNIKTDAAIGEQITGAIRLAKKEGYNPSGITSSDGITMPAPKHTVTYHGNNGKFGTSATTTMAIEYNTAYSLPIAPTLAGYTFKGWFDTQATTGGNQITAETMMTKTAAHTLYARWAINSYTATFAANGGGTVKPATITKTYNTAIGTLPTVSRTGYTFSAWYNTDAKSGGTKITANTVMPAKNITYYARWTANKYKVTFNGNSGKWGTQTTTSKSISYDANYALPKKPTKTGYTFKGWYDTSAKTGGKQVTTATQMKKTGAHTLYARWAINSYTATFDKNGGNKPSKATITKTYNTAIGKLPTITRNGCLFKGWYTAKSGGTKISDKTKLKKKITYYAQWTVTAKFSANGGTKLSTSSIKKDYKAKIGKLPTITPPKGYKFKGWYTKGGTKLTTTTQLTKNLTYYAQWKK